MAQSPSTVCVLTGCGSQTVGPLAHLTLDPQGKSPGGRHPAPGPSPQPRHLDFILGRSLNADVLIRDVQISRQHALIQVRWGGPGPGPTDQWWLQDHRSINGVFVNGRPIPAQSFVPLKHGDRISLEPKHGYQWQVHLRPAPPLPPDPASAPPMGRSTPAAHPMLSPSPDAPAAKRAKLAGRGPAPSPTSQPALTHPESEPGPASSSRHDSENPKNPAQLVCQNSENQSSAHEPEPEPASSSQRDSENPKNPAQLECQNSENQSSAHESEPEPASSSQRDSEKPKNPAQLECQNSESQSSGHEPEPGPSRSGIGPLETPRSPGQSQSQGANRAKMNETDPGPSSSFKAKFSEELSCTICNEMFIQPKTLPCGHVFCAFCVLQWKKRCGSAMSCPNCRQKVGRDKITPNVYVENLINNFIQSYGDDMKAERERQMAERSAQEEAAARAGAEREMKRDQSRRGRRGRGRRGRGASTSRTIRDMFSRVDAPNPGDHRLPQPSNSSQNRGGTAMYSMIDVESDSDEDDSDEDILVHANESDSSEDSLSDSPVPGDPNAPYGGYGYCYGCGRTGHWLPGCLGL